jgi:hypothetical protein
VVPGAGARLRDDLRILIFCDSTPAAAICVVCTLCTNTEFLIHAFEILSLASTKRKVENNVFLKMIFLCLLENSLIQFLF